MSEKPPLAGPALAMPGAVFSPIADRLRSAPQGVCPLHVGDTWLEPFDGARMQDLAVDSHAGLHRYCETRGVPELVEALTAKLRERNGLDADPTRVLVTAGATGALSSAFGAIASPGSEVLVLTPYWPLIRGMIQAFHATPIEVPFYDRVTSAEEAVAAVSARRSARTVALYVSSPSNPTGRVIPGAWLEALAAWARRENLWLFSDEVYEDHVYRGDHVSPGRFAPERTLSVYSFSKAYGMAGNRTGYLTGPAALVEQALKVSTHTAYHAPTAGQVAAIRALASGAAWLGEARAQYQRVGDRVAERLGVPAPEGSTFLFLDVAPQLDDRGLWGFLADCVDDGVALTPGPSCGAEYESWVRLCYTAAPPDEVLAAVDRLAARLGR
ncbi:MAG: pyridoxal phosphate-dependent aminotransferase [Myxococcota bacterium]